MEGQATLQNFAKSPPLAEDKRPLHPTSKSEVDAAPSCVGDTSTGQIVPPIAAGGTKIWSQDSDRVLVSRRTIQGYVVLLLGIGCAAFLLGRASAPNRAPRDARSSSGGQGSADAMLVMGHVFFAARGKPLAPDKNAVVVALPLNPPEERLPIEGLRPWSVDAVARDVAVKQLLSLGGSFAQADADGQINLVLPRAGTYYLLVISKGLARSAAVTSRPNRGIDELDLKQLSRYFDRPADLIGPQAYSWSRVEMRPGMPPLRQVFQEDDLGLGEIGLH